MQSNFLRLDSLPIPNQRYQKTKGLIAIEQLESTGIRNNTNDVEVLNEICYSKWRITESSLSGSNRLPILMWYHHPVFSYTNSRKYCHSIKSYKHIYIHVQNI